MYDMSICLHIYMFTHIHTGIGFRVQEPNKLNHLKQLGKKMEADMEAGLTVLWDRTPAGCLVGHEAIGTNYKTMSMYIVGKY